MKINSPRRMTKESDMKKIVKTVEKCKKCDLWRTRSNTVPGSGSIDADILFIGEAPGRNEDLQGKPFVGRAGKILDELLESIGMQRDEIYVSNVLKCRPVLSPIGKNNICVTCKNFEKCYKNYNIIK
jgi:DNA polymerase